MYRRAGITLTFTIIISSLLISCTSKAEKAAGGASDLQNEQDYPLLEFPKSEINLPYEGNIAAYNVRVDTLNRRDIINADSYFGTENVLPFIILPPKGDINLLLNPIKDLGYARGYRLLTVKGNRILSSLLIEGEWTSPTNERNTELTTCFIDEFSNINVQKTITNSGLKTFLHNDYKISDDGFIVEEKIAEAEGVDLSDCIDAPVAIKGVLSSKTLPNLEFQQLECEDLIQGIEEYSCYDGVFYKTLNKTADLIYLLVYSECGDSAFTDFVILKNGKVVSGLTLDGSSEGYPTENSLYVVSFDIQKDFSIKLEEKLYEKDKLVSTQHSSFLISKDGTGFIKQQ